MTSNTQDGPPFPRHITLIGMPGVGKSTLGRRLAKHLSYTFIDVDLEIQKQSQMSLHDFIQEKGDDAFIALEQTAILGLDFSEPSIIATGGSAVYSTKAMIFLQKKSTVIYLRDTLNNITKRIPNLFSRGIVGLGDKTLETLFAERTKLYETFAHRTVDLKYALHESQILEVLKTS
jgi:shikimate kinase